MYLNVMYFNEPDWTLDAIVSNDLHRFYSHHQQQTNWNTIPIPSCYEQKNKGYFYGTTALQEVQQQHPLSPLAFMAYYYYI